MSKLEVNTVAPQCGTTLTLGESGDTVTLGTGASQSGFGRTGTVDWDTTKKTTGFTAVSGNGYFCDTAASGAFTATLPSSPSAGDIVSVKDYNGNFATANLTIGRGGSNIQGAASDVLLTVANTGATFIYIDGTEGWQIFPDGSESDYTSPYMCASGGTVTTDGNCRIHKFTGPGTFTVNSVGSTAANNLVSYVVVAGGGGGGTGDEGGAGGGGAGGFRETKSPATSYSASPLDGYGTPGNRITVTATGYPIAVGSGGTANAAGSAPTAGSTSTFSTISSAGGGIGGYGASPYSGSATAGGNGGSGGGGFAYIAPVGGNAAGSGNTPSTTPAQGTNGGTGQNSCSSALAQNGGGGGGATAVGANGANYPGPGEAGDGGAGATTSIVGTPTAYAGGGGGGRRWDPPSGAPGTGGTGGGGNGGYGKSPGGVGTAGTANTGGGGGGGGGCSGNDFLGGNGGSGVVIIRYRYQ